MSKLPIPGRRQGGKAAERGITPIADSMPIADIRVGKRHRKDMGDIAGLAASITDLGLLHPVVVRPDGTLIAGERRLKACLELGWDKVPVTIMGIDKIARGEHDENEVRKDFTITEAVAIKREIEAEVKAAAKERQKRRPICSGKLPEQAKGETRDKVAKATGKKARTLAKAEAVVKAAEAEPEKFTQLVEEMDESGNVESSAARSAIMMSRRLKKSRHYQLRRSRLMIARCFCGAYGPSCRAPSPRVAGPHAVATRSDRTCRRRWRRECGRPVAPWRARTGQARRWN